MDTSVQETFTEVERRRLMQIIIAAMPNYKRDEELLSILSKLNGNDTQLIAIHARPRRAANAQ